MTAKLRSSILLAIAASVGAFLCSCTYEPYGYGPTTSVGSSVRYSSNGHVSSSVFIRTSSSRWGYDPHCRSYYDYTRQCYYDPWLRGYYPRGYRPPVIVGIPHPHGWRSGQRTCPPPVHVRSHTIRDHHRRYDHYRRLNHSWCRDLRTTSNSHRSSHHNSHNNSHWDRSNRSNHSSHQNNHQRHTSHRDHHNQNHGNHSSNRSNHSSNWSNHSSTRHNHSTNRGNQGNNHSSSTNRKPTTNLQSLPHGGTKPAWARTSSSSKPLPMVMPKPKPVVTPKPKPMVAPKPKPSSSSRFTSHHSSTKPKNSSSSKRKRNDNDDD